MIAAEVTRIDIEEAASRTRGWIRSTPTLRLGHVLSDRWDLTLKLDHLQPTGSFKVRGAFNVLLANDLSEGVVAASGGNFGKAIAYATSELGIPGTIFVPSNSPEEKVGQIAQYGAAVHIIDGYYDEALAASVEFVETHQLKPIIDATFTLTEADRALEQMKSSPQFGKYVLRV